MAENYFVGIYDPVDVRRNLLESSKEAVESLQSFTKLEDIRKKKIRHVREMKIIMEELDLLVGKLREKLPKSHLRNTLDISDKPKQGAVKFTSELERLESQLNELESELSAIE